MGHSVISGPRSLATDVCSGKHLPLLTYEQRVAFSPTNWDRDSPAYFASPSYSGRHFRPRSCSPSTPRSIVGGHNYYDFSPFFSMPHNEIQSESPTPGSNTKNVNHGWINTNRWVLGAISGSACVFTACVWFGWQQYALILMRGGAFSWLCTGTDFDTTPASTYLVCPSQERAVNSLFVYGAASECIGSIIAGVLLDQMGPRICASIGELLAALSCFLLIFASESFRITPVAVILAGLAANIIAFPSLILADFFPERAAMAISYTIACQCLATAVAPCIWELWSRNSAWTFNGIWTTYLLCVILPVSLIYILVLPGAIPGTAAARDEFEDNLPTIPDEFLPSEPVDCMRKQNKVCLQMQSFDSEIPGEVGGAANAVAAHISIHCDCPLSDDASPKFLIQKCSKCPKLDTCATGVNIRPLLSELLSTRFLLLAVFNVVQMIQNAYYPVVVRTMSGDNIADFVGWIMPAQAVTGFILGSTVDKVGNGLMLMVMITSTLVVYALALVNSTSNLQYLTGLIFVIFNAFAYTPKFTYIKAVFPAQDYGKLVGIAALLGGVSMLINIPLAEDTRYEMWCGIMMAACVALVPVVVVMWKEELKYTSKTVGQETVSFKF